MERKIYFMLLRADHVPQGHCIKNILAVARKVSWFDWQHLPWVSNRIERY